MGMVVLLHDTTLTSKPSILHHTGANERKHLHAFVNRLFSIFFFIFTEIDYKRQSYDKRACLIKFNSYYRHVIFWFYE